MTNMELALTNLGKVTAVEIHKKNNSQGINELTNDVKDAGKVINMAKNEIEKKLEKPLVSSENYIELTSKELIETK